MPKYEVVVRPLGLLNGVEWPEVGESVELSEEVGDVMADAGDLKKAKAEKKAEKRPASKAGEEKRG